MSIEMYANRPLHETERRLAVAMLQFAQTSERYLKQLDHAMVTPWRCDCGCASVQFEIAGLANPHLGIQPLADFTFDLGEGSIGIFIYASDEVLAGIEVYSGEAEASKTLPTPELLRYIVWQPDGTGKIE